LLHLLPNSSAISPGLRNGSYLSELAQGTSEAQRNHSLREPDVKQMRIQLEEHEERNIDTV